MPRNTNYSKKLNVFQPRITMMTAIDQFGDVYWTLLQANSNNLTMELVLTNFALTLDKERPGWRKNTIFQLDGASWHTSSDTLDVLKRLNITCIISGPYSYEAAPIELFFGCFKKGNINP